MNITYRLPIVATTLAWMLCGTPADAELISANLVPGSNDQLLTYDTQTGLEWLDVTQTVNRTYDEVRTGPWYQLGFRHATLEELETLFTNAGTPDDGFEPSVTFPNETQALIALFGRIFDAGGPINGAQGYATYGWVATDVFGNPITLESYPIGAENLVPILGKLVFLPANPDAGFPDLGEAYVAGEQPFGNEASSLYGSFLVRRHTRREVFLHGNGPVNPPSLSLSEANPKATSASYKDSGSLHFSGGNPWQEVGAWSALPEATAGTIETLSDLHVWLGLRNSDDQGTKFDLRAELYKGDQLMASRLLRCVSGLTRGTPAELAVSFESFTPATFDGSSDVLTLRLTTRIGTNPNDTKCPGHSNATGLRVYFDGLDQASRFEVIIP